MKTPLSLLALGLLLVGCAKEKSYETVYKESVFSKNMLESDKDDPWVYVPSVENTPMNVTASRPFWQGEQKLVVFKFREKHLEVLQLPDDPRFIKNENNYSPVVKLSIDHKDYRCKEDQYGECSNTEEEVDDKSWDSKRFFKTDFAQLAVLEANSLPEQLTNLFERCFSFVSSRVKDLKIEQGALNITVERDVIANIECADVQSFDDLRNMAFKINHHYSFVKLSKLADKNYKPVAYPNTDQNTFGFFTSVVKKLSADNQSTLDSDLTLMNRFSPNRKEIVYHLSEDFYDADMKAIKKATEKSVETINKSFAEAGVDLKIKLADGRGKVVGDLRNNFIVLVKDPQASGVIGYGPSVANPLTGEILKAQTVMYYGTIRKFIQETYDELVEDAGSKASLKLSSAAQTSKEVVANGAIKNGANEMMLTSLSSGRAMSLSASRAMKQEVLDLFSVQDQISTLAAAPLVTLDQPSLNSGKIEARLAKEIFSHERIHKHYDLEDQIEEYSRNNMYHESMVNWQDSLAAAVEAGELVVKGAKPWNTLSESAKEKLIEKLMPFVWVPTLVHELGHNLGLRHNFSASEDKDNYYNDLERQQMGINRKITYSSVMDYAYSNLNQLSIMGKYDIAALRFGYNRQVQKTDGTIVSMPKSTLEEMKKDGSIESLKDFKFCTDEHVAVNAGCKRHDEGASLTEIATHIVKAHKKRWETRYKRNNRLHFSSQNDDAAFMGSRQTFQNLRVFFESFDRIKGMYPSLAPAQWESIEFLKDLKAANKIAVDFMVEVLKTPSVHCAVVSKSTGKLAGIVPLEDITFDAISCFDEENLNIDSTKFAVVAETGKHFNHARSPDLRGDIKADPTQISIRGIWMDKVMAMDYLMKREMKISTFDDFRTSYIDHPEFKDQVMEAVLGYVTDKISHKEIKFVTADGQVIPLEHDFMLEDTHKIKKSFAYGLNAFLGIKKASTDIRELALPMLKKNLASADDETTTQGLLQSLSVYRVDPTVPVTGVSAQIKLKDDAGKIVSQFVATESNTLAIKLMKDHELRTMLDKHTRAKLIEVYTAKASGNVPAEIPAALKDIFALEIAKLEAYLMGEMPTDKKLHQILDLIKI